MSNTTFTDYVLTLALPDIPVEYRQFSGGISKPTKFTCKLAVQNALVVHIRDLVMANLKSDINPESLKSWIDSIRYVIEAMHEWNPQHPLIVQTDDGLITIEPYNRETEK